MSYRLRLARARPHSGYFAQASTAAIGGEGFTTALTAAIADADALALLDRLGSRKGNDVGVFPGTIDQAVDSTDVLSHPARCRAAAALLGLPCRTAGLALTPSLSCQPSSESIRS